MIGNSSIKSNDNGLIPQRELKKVRWVGEEGGQRWSEWLTRSKFVEGVYRFRPRRTTSTKFQVLAKERWAAFFRLDFLPNFLIKQKVESTVSVSIYKNAYICMVN